MEFFPEEDEDEDEEDEDEEEAAAPFSQALTWIDNINPDFPTGQGSLPWMGRAQHKKLWRRRCLPSQDFGLIFHILVHTQLSSLVFGILKDKMGFFKWKMFP